jgi:hypothetical protein
MEPLNSARIGSSPLSAPRGSGIFPPMSTLAEIEQAADALTPEQKQELILFLAARLRADGAQMPAPRKFTKEEMAGWIAEDEADMERFRRGLKGLNSQGSTMQPLQG